MKGIELPINILVVVAIAVIVLLGLVAMYFIGFSPFSGAISVEGAKNLACGELVRKGCNSLPCSINITNFDANGNNVIDPGTETTCTYSCGVGNTDNLARLCGCYYSRTTASDCRQLCGCP